MGMANPIPTLPGTPVIVAIAVFIPMISPLIFTRGPPLLPGLMAASVWMKFLYVVLFISIFDLPVALTIPAVTVWLNLNGLPMARTHSPT